MLASSLLPAVLVLLIGWLQIRRQINLWTLPSVEQALDASMQANRSALDRLQRHLETEGRILAESGFIPSADTTELGSLLESGVREFGIDLAQYYAADGDRFRLVASRGPIGPGGPDGARELRPPIVSPAGPQRPRPIRLGERGLDHLAVPTYLWESAEGDSSRLRGALVLGVSLGPGFYDRLMEVGHGLQLYRRLREVGLLLQTGYALLAILALAVGFGVSFWVARRVAGSVSRPVDALIRDMDAVGRPGDSLGSGQADAASEPRDRPSSIPEMVRLADAFASMRRTLAVYEGQLREAERVRGGQETARFVAHEIRNTLTPVRASLSVLESQLREHPEGDRSRSERALELIRREADRMASLAGAFSEYARFPEPNPTFLDPAALVEEIARAEVPARIELTVARPPEVPPVRADREEMERIFRNLVKNAVEAMPEAGSLRVAIRVEAGAIEISLADTGCGMNEETLHKVFQPGFTTKETGTGLGLALVRRSLSQYGGTIRLESRLGAGTTCRVRLPAAPQER